MINNVAVAWHDSFPELFLSKFHKLLVLKYGSSSRLLESTRGGEMITTALDTDS